MLVVPLLLTLLRAVDVWLLIWSTRRLVAPDDTVSLPAVSVRTFPVALDVPVPFAVPYFSVTDLVSATTVGGAADTVLIVTFNCATAVSPDESAIS